MEYLLKSTFILSLFYGFYILFLQKDTFFQSIRFYFLSGIVTALVIPFITIKEYVFKEPVLYSGFININEGKIQNIQNTALSWNQILIMVYMAGVIFFSVKFLIQLSSLLWFLYKNPKNKKGNFVFVNSNKDVAPFSFFKYIVLNPTTFNTNELDQIIAHEKIHAKQFHSVDHILIQILAIFNWFNPFVWSYSRVVQKNLEFIADEHAQGITSKNQNYQHLLLKTISPHYQMALTSNFYNSLIKKRIDMLQKNRSSKTMQIKFLLIIPMLITFVFTFNTKVIAQQKSDWKVEIITNSVDFYETIDKDFTKKDLENLKTRLASQDVSFKYKKLKYNSNNEIIGISISVKDKNSNQSNFSQKSETPIKTILINISSKGTLSIGNLTGMQNNHNVLFSPDDDSLYKTVIVNSDKKGDKNIIWITDEDSTTLSMGGDKKKSYAYTIKRVDGEDDLRVGYDGGSDSDKNFIFISDGKVAGNSSKIKIIELDDQKEGKHMMMIKTDQSTKGNSFVIKIDDDKIDASNNKNTIYRSDNNKNPLIILDGKEMKDKKIDDIAPDTIESISVFKGDK
ncbi:MAG: hypothetical protein J7K34_04665, partial [Flavobacteriaceae bacterium]|nr:hypothetical protein [Flavobacteriaceae bacterium]